MTDNTEIKNKYEKQCLKCKHHFYDYFTLNNMTYQREICEKQHLTGLNLPCEDFKEDYRGVYSFIECKIFYDFYSF